MSDAPPAAVLDARELRRALGQFATGVTIVTCLAPDGTPVGMTANSFASVSLEPPLVLWSLDNRAKSYPAFSRADRFAISVLSQDQAELSNRFAHPGVDKFGSVDWTRGLGGVPLMPGAAAIFECVTDATHPGGDHLIIVGKVERFERDERNALVFAQGRYGALAPHPGPAGSEESDAVDGRHPYDDFLVPLLFRAYNHLFGSFAEALTAADFTGAQMRILSILAASGPAEEDALLTRSMLSQTNYEEARDTLLAAGLIAPDGDRQRVTAAGEEKLAELLRLAAQRELTSTGGLDDTEVGLLRQLLRKLVQQHEDVR